jgi:omega-6 fatty acid desaturase (delta-12 desaturase)
MSTVNNIKIDKTLLKSLNKYTQTSRSKAIIQIINSFGPFIAIWILMYLSLDYSYWITFGLGIINAFFLVRIFIIQHDCGHRTFLDNSKARAVIGYICSVFSTIPYHYWAKSHHLHHAHNGQLELRDIGDIDTLTVNEFKVLNKWGRFKYRLYRSFLVMFILGPIYYVVIHNRLPMIKMDVFKNEKWRLWLNNFILILIFLTLGYFLGFGKFLLTHFTIIVIFSVIAIWFFYVQHQHEEAYKQWRDKWDYLTAAIRGSTYYKVPKIFNWLTGNIGIHHIHHLNPAIPNYNLKSALAENQWINQYVTIVTFWQSLKLASNKLWDESTQRMITFAEYYKMEKAGMV